MANRNENLPRIWLESEEAMTGNPRCVGSRMDEIISGREGIYVIQKHTATRLHYDLRLEMDGVLKSWAVPKQPPVSRGVRRLAIEVDDHDLDYADFEGVIPEGQYGAGTVEVWDRGTHRLVERDEKKIVTDIKGEKLHGRYGLVMFRHEKGKRMWLFFKEKTD